MDLVAIGLSSESPGIVYRIPLARSSSRSGHGPLKAGARVRVPYALPRVATLWTRATYDWTGWSEKAEIVTYLVTRPPGVHWRSSLYGERESWQMAAPSVLAGALTHISFVSPLRLILRCVPRHSCP